MQFSQSATLWAPALLAIVFAQCAPAAAYQDLRLESSSLKQGDIHYLNERIELAFSKSIELDTVNFSNIRIVGPSSVPPVQGLFYAKPGTDQRVIVFQPSCATLSDLSDGGLIPGDAFTTIRYQLSVLATVRSVDGNALRNPYSLEFETARLPSTVYLDPKPQSAPKVISDTLPASLSLNLFSDPLMPLLLTLDQPVFAASIEDNSIRVECTDPASGIPWDLPVSTVLLSNCNITEQAQLGVLFQGILPPGRELRFFLSSSVRGLGEFDFNLEEIQFHSAMVEEANSPQPDFILEEFLDPSILDESAPLFTPSAIVNEGVLQAGIFFPSASNGIEIEIGPFTSNGSNVYFSTDSSTLKDTQGQLHHFENGIIEVDRFTIKSPLSGQDSSLKVLGLNPLIIRTTEQFLIEEGACLSLDGQTAPDVSGIQLPQYPSPGGAGSGSGGDGGAGSPSSIQSDPKGGDGSGAFQQPGQGGKGGHSAFGSTNPYSTRPGGGGGGSWGIREKWNGDWVQFCYGAKGCTNCPDCAPSCDGIFPPTNSNGENGNTGVQNSIDAVQASTPAMGGARSPEVFLDGLNDNHFCGKKVHGTSILFGELLSLQGGAGGGAGGDNVPNLIFPSGPNFLYIDKRGAGGGAGAGAVQVQSLGPLIVRGKISANGGNGGAGEEMDFGHRASGGGGGGAGGMIDLESSSYVLLGANALLTAHGGDRGPGSGNAAGTQGSGNNCGKKNNTAARGGAGGKGLIQIRIPFEESSGQIEIDRLRIEIDSSGNFQEILSEDDALLRARSEPDPHVLLPQFGPRSSALSKWTYLGPIHADFMTPEIQATAPESVVIRFQGASESELGSGIPDPQTISELQPQLNTLGGKTLLRFRVDFVRNDANSLPAIQFIKIPFAF